MRVDEMPIPARVAARPRDERGYPVPAITPWQDGKPQFALTSVSRTYICAMERRCSVCGEAMGPGPVWRVIAGPESDAVADALEAGRTFINRAPTAEAPGHRACMLYAAVTCPYLARPGARRGQPVDVAGVTSDRGGKRGSGGAVAAFEQVQFKLEDTVLFRFAGLVEYLPHELGAEQSAALAEEIAKEGVAAASGQVVPDTIVVPAYMLGDEEAADRRFAELKAK